VNGDVTAIKEKGMVKKSKSKGSIYVPSKGGKIVPIANTDICYVCGGVVNRETDEYWEAPPSEKYPDGVIRHNSCAPGTENWKESPSSKKYRDYFKKEKKESVTKPIKNPFESLAKEFTGKIKYLMFMETKSKYAIRWTINYSDDDREMIAVFTDDQGLAITVNGKNIPYDKDTILQKVIDAIT
jgi:hypothetical protein